MVNTKPFNRISSSSYSSSRPILGSVRATTFIQHLFQVVIQMIILRRTISSTRTLASTSSWNIGLEHMWWYFNIQHLLDLYMYSSITSSTCTNSIHIYVLELIYNIHLFTRPIYQIIRFGLGLAFRLW